MAEGMLFISQSNLKMSHSSKKQLILGMAVGMKLEHLQPFFLSLEKAGYRGDVCMYVADLEPPALAFLRTHRVNLVPFQKAYLKRKWGHLATACKFFMKPWQQRRFDEQMLLTYLHLHCARAAYHRAYLTECGKEYDHVLLADTRDILFQRDPFDFEIPEGLSTFLEDPSQKIGNNISNSTWMREGYGATVLKELADQRIHCAGTILGSPAVLVNYLDQVLQLYAARKPLYTIDQTTHNYILQKQPPKVWRAFDNDTGPVFTMAQVNPSQFRFNEQGLMVNAHGRIFNTLHQYDRHPRLAQQLIKSLT
jgi:hypothetical protein